MTLESDMKIEIKVELDTDKQDDLDLVEDIFEQLQDIKEILEAKQQNLNKRNTAKKKVVI